MFDRKKFGQMTAGMLGRRIDPHQLSAFVKYAFLSRVIAELQIELILDVGANRGQFAKSMRGIGYRGQIISFEPVAEEFRHLTTLSSGDYNWRSFNIALGDKDGKETINVMKSGLFSSFNTPSSEDTEQFIGSNEVVDKREVVVKCLDAVLDELSLSSVLKKTLLKSDTQGHEINVFKGAGKYLREIGVILAEISSIPIYKDVPTALEVTHFLKEEGFLPVSFFPVNHEADWRAIEFDLLAVNSWPAGA